VIYWVRHRTTYTYESEVGYARCVLRLTPPSNGRQTVLEHAIAITPEPSDTLVRDGPFGEATRTVVIGTPHRKLIVEATSWVDVDAPPAEPEGGPPWEEVRERAFRSAALDASGPAPYLYPTPRTPIAADITAYARRSFAAGRPILEAAEELMERLHHDFTYDAKATTVRSTAAQAFEARRGVCQDFAHVMIAGLRGLGLPAGYVSGYLRTTPPPGRPRLQGADATHAWVTLWSGDGWAGFDPTNAVREQNHHVCLATGRDYGDVAPIDGITLSPGEQALKVEVDVIPEEELGAEPVGRPVVTQLAARRPARTP
jgi:transglutaminase-like putative cysteine protease